MWKIQRYLAWLLDSCTKVLGNKEELRMFFGVKVQQRNWMFFGTTRWVQPLGISRLITYYSSTYRGRKTQLDTYKAICRGTLYSPFCQRWEGTNIFGEFPSRPCSPSARIQMICVGGAFGGSPHWLGVTLDGWTFQSSKDGVYLGIGGQYILENCPPWN